MAEIDFEDRRQLIHIFIGLGIAWFLVSFGRQLTLEILSCVLLIGMVLSNEIILHGRRIAILSDFLNAFERKKQVPGKGAMMFVFGSLIAICFANSVNSAAAVVAVLALGDGLSTLAGVRGSHKLPWNGKKSLEGSIAFAFGALIALPAFIALSANKLQGVAFLTAIAESLPIEIDDNLLIPIIATALFYLI